MSDSESAARVKNSQSKSFRKLNPYIFGGGPLLDEKHPYGHVNPDGGEDDAEHDHIEVLTRKPDAIQCAKCGEWVTDPSKHRHPFPKAKKRIRQSEKPLLNKLETEFQNILSNRYASNLYQITAQAIRFSLGNGIAYKPDFVVFGQHERPRAYECKGPHSFRGGFENLKVAANKYPLVQFMLVWKENGIWQYQHVLP